MSTVSFKRSPNVNNIPIIDGQLIFDETHNKIYMDNGDQRLQYGGDVSLIENVDYATTNNAFSASGTVNLFTQKSTVVDNKDSALAATEQHLPVGCLAFQSAIGTADYSSIGNTISDSLLTLKNNILSINGQLTANDNPIYMDYHDGKYGVNTSSTRGADTFIPFKSSYTETVNFSYQATYNNHSHTWANQDATRPGRIFVGAGIISASGVWGWCRGDSFSCTFDTEANTYTVSHSGGAWYGTEEQSTYTVSVSVMLFYT